MAAPENPFAVSVQNPELTYSRGMYNKPQDYVNKARLASFAAKGELAPGLEDLTAESFDYSPEAQAYLNRVDEYLSKTQGGPYEVSPYGFSVTDRQTGAARPLTNEELMALAAKPDFENQFAASFGDPTGEEAWDIGRFAVRPDQEVRLINRDTGEVVASGMGYEGGSLAAKAAAGIFGQEGKKANFILQGASPGGDWETITEHKPERSGFGQFVATALPLAMMPLTMGATAPLAKIGTLAKIGLGAGVGGASSAARGQDILKGAITGGLTAAGTQFLPGPLKSLGIDDKVLRQSIGAGLGATTGGVVTGQPLDKSLMGGAIAAGTTYIGGKLFNPATTPVDQTTAADTSSAPAGGQNAPAGTPTSAPVDPLSPNITVTGIRSQIPFVAPVNRLFGNVQYSGGENVRDRQPPQEEKKDFRENEEIIVTGNRATPVIPPVYSLDAAIKKLVDEKYPQPEIKEPVIKKNEKTGEDDIIVTAKDTSYVMPSVFSATLEGMKPAFTQDPSKPAEKSTTDKIADYLKIAGLGVGLIGNIAGGGGKGSGASAGKYSTGRSLGSTFSAKLPTPGEGGSFTVGGLGTGVGATAGDRTFAARPIADYYRYGMGRALDIPEDADLSRATSPYAGYGPGTLGAETYRAVSGMPQQPVGMAHGGDMGYSRGSSRESFAVEGPGTGRSDDIPAVLSDGEYVIDAETVALLGDGSSKAGAKKLDEMRVKIRKHKGKNLAKGKFSVNAKHPEAYMSGGRI